MCEQLFEVVAIKFLAEKNVGAVIAVVAAAQMWLMMWLIHGLNLFMGTPKACEEGEHEMTSLTYFMMVWVVLFIPYVLGILCTLCIYLTACKK